jgi:hypothetical protein
MPTQQTVITAFVASPGDVLEERTLLQEIVDELNLTWSKQFGVRLELLRWETHTFPGVGAYPQEVINRQIGDDYDIFIGIMWKRFGTATPEYESGTEEEFQRAYERYKANPEAVDIMYYFKDAPVNPSQLDLGQLQRVLEFKKKLGNEGTYHWSFNSRDQFQQFLRVHLSRTIQRWISPAKTSSSPSAVAVMAPARVERLPIDDDDEELGLLDHIELGLKAFATGTESADRLSVATLEVGKSISMRTEQVEALKRPDGSYDPQGARRVANLSAEDLLLFASRVEAELPLFASIYRKGLDHLTAAANVAVEDFSPKRIEIMALRDAIAVHEPMLEEGLTQIARFRESIVNLPRLHSGFNKARRRAANVLEKLLEEISFAKQVSADAVKLLDDVLQKLPE